jgi:predicted ribosome quality control (RQC) complex YloA/Tae2 family protein
MGEAMDALYADYDVREHMRRRGQAIRRILQNNIERCEKKLSLYAQAIEADENIEQYRLYGELITANLHALRQNAAEAAVMNYYLDPPGYTVIPMDKRYTPNENAQRYYKKYQKARSAKKIAITQRTQTLEELSYLEGQLDNMDKCTTDAELAELEQELKEQGYMRAEKTKGKPKKLPESKPLHYLASDGTDIFVGKNNLQNDQLTLRFAGENDRWLHTKEIPGSHVIITSDKPSDATLVEAAMLAAWYSKARGGANVAVDYTPRKYVKKPSGAKPGMVIYTTNRTVYVTPEEGTVKKLREV